MNPLFHCFSETFSCFLLTFLLIWDFRMNKFYSLSNQSTFQGPNLVTFWSLINHLNWFRSQILLSLRKFCIQRENHSFWHLVHSFYAISSKVENERQLKRCSTISSGFFWIIGISTKHLQELWKYVRISQRFPAITSLFRLGLSHFHKKNLLKHKFLFVVVWEFWSFIKPILSLRIIFS